MRSPMRPLAGMLVALVSILVLVAPGPASATAAQVGAASYATSGDVVAGWGWLRGTGDTATWTFTQASLGTFKARTVHLNVSALVTNRINGGSGFDASGIKFKLVSGRVTQTLVLSLHNPFRPQDAADSGGVGYAAYGSSANTLKPALFTTGQPISVTVAYPFPQRRHVAFQQSSLTLAFTR